MNINKKGEPVDSPFGVIYKIFYLLMINLEGANSLSF